MNFLSNLRINKRIIIVVVSVLFLIEAVWAFRTLNIQDFVATNTSRTTKQALSDNATAILLKADKTNLQVGQVITVNIEERAFSPTDGTDIIINYNPKLMSVVLNSKDNSPVAVGRIYNDFPVNGVDENAGRIAVSGIASAAGGVLPNGVFGTVSFRAKASGKAIISVDFTPGSTTDSNIIESKTSQDLLNGVENLEVNIK